MSHKIRILQGTAADFFDRCCADANLKGKKGSFAEGDVISMDIPLELLRRAVEVFGSKERSLYWFIAPNHALGGVCPGELLERAQGKIRVLDELGRIESGVFV